jgi:hypothetical protein
MRQRTKQELDRMLVSLELASSLGIMSPKQREWVSTFYTVPPGARDLGDLWFEEDVA